MKRKSFLYIVLLCLIFSQKSTAQDLQFSLEEERVSQFGSTSDLVSFNPLFRLKRSTIYNQNSEQKIRKLPKQISQSKLVYGFLFFTGNPNPAFEKEIVFLVDNYQSNAPEVFVDYNGNMDFTDDGESLIFDKDQLIIKLKNDTFQQGSLLYTLGKNKVTSKNQSRLKNRFASKYPQSEIVNVEYWFTNQRLSVNLSTHTLKKEPITILTYDANGDGILTFEPNEFGDRILIVEGAVNKNSDLSEYVRRGEPVDHNAVFLLYGKKYSIQSITEDAKKLVLKETTKNTSIKTGLGSNIKDLTIVLLNGKKIQIDSLLQQDKHILLDFGATWCAGCVMQEPIIKEMFKADKLYVVGLFAHDTKQSVERYVQKHQVKWPVALLSKKIKQKLNINSYPTYVLLSPTGKILLIDLNADKIKEHFQ